MAEASTPEFRLARVGGLEVIATPLAAVGTLLLGAIFFTVGRFVFNHGNVAAPEVHVRRAIVGPAASALLTVAVGLLALLVGRTGLGWVQLVWFLDNLVVFTLGALLPLGFTDGSSLLRYLRRQRASAPWL